MKYIYIALGFLSLGLGVIGVIMPLVPITPFLIFSAFCFAKASRRLNTWFKSTKLYKDNIESLVKKEGLTKVAKIRILTSITLIFVVAAFFMHDTKVGLICLLIVWLGHIFGFAICVRNKATDSEVI